MRCLCLTLGAVSNKNKLSTRDELWLRSFTFSQPQNSLWFIILNISDLSLALKCKITKTQAKDKKANILCYIHTAYKGSLVCFFFFVGFCASLFLIPLSSPLMLSNLSRSHRGRHVGSLCSNLLQTYSHQSIDICSLSASPLHIAALYTPTAGLKDIIITLGYSTACDCCKCNTVTHYVRCRCRGSQSNRFC